MVLIWIKYSAVSNAFVAKEGMEIEFNGTASGIKFGKFDDKPWF